MVKAKKRPSRFELIRKNLRSISTTVKDIKDNRVDKKKADDELSLILDLAISDEELAEFAKQNVFKIAALFDSGNSFVTIERDPTGQILLKMEDGEPF